MWEQELGFGVYGLAVYATKKKLSLALDPQALNSKLKP